MRQFITPNSVAATIRMLRSTFAGSFLVVEGDIDARLYGRLVDRRYCHVQVCNNRSNVICVVKLLDHGAFVGHLGIIDRDFSGLVEQSDYVSDNLMLTDENDIELTILCSDTLDRFLSEYGNGNKITSVENGCKEPIREALIRSASWVGTLLLLSRKKHWNLVFEGMTFQFSDRHQFHIELDRQIEHLRGRSPGTSMPSLAEVRAEVIAARTGQRQLAHTRGCDLCEILSKGVHDVFGRNHHHLARGGLAVQEIIRAAYSQENFCQTKLYAGISAWETQHPPFTVLPRP